MLTLSIEEERAKITAIEAAKFRQIEQLKSQLSSQNTMAYQSEIRQLTLKFQSDISKLQYDIRQYRQAIEMKNHEIENLQIRLQRLESQSSSISQEKYR